MPSAALTLRNTKGSALTFTEMDDNLTNLATAANASASLSGASFTGNVEMNNNYLENVILEHTVEKVANLGLITGTQTISGNTAPIQIGVLTGGITINTNNFTNFDPGQTITLVLIQDNTGSRTLTSNLRFAGSSKTLSTAASSVDTVSVTYDGVRYLAALVKGYA